MKKETLRRGGVYALLTIWGIFVLFPFYWMLLTSVKSYSSYNSEYIPKLFTLTPTLQNYVDAFKAVPLGQYFFNTIVFTVVTTALMLIVTVLAAFAFARLNFRGKNLAFTLFLSLMMIPNELVVITDYVTITDGGLRNTFAGLILPSVTSVFYIYLLKENFAQIPDELYYAAKVDGTSDLKYLFKVMIPICQPTIVTVTVLKVIECWNSYVWPRLVTTDQSHFLVSVGIQEIRENGFGRENIPAMMAAVVVISLPLIVLFLLFHKKSWRAWPEEAPRDEKRLFAALLVLSLMLSGCHGARERTTFRLPEDLDTSRNFTVTFWAKNDTNINQVNVYKQAIGEFEALYPNITVEMRLYTDYGRIYNDVITNIATGTTPNVCITYPDHIATYLTGENVVVPLDDLLTDAGYGLGGKKVNFDAPAKGEMVPEFLAECSFGGHQYALPFMRSTEACYVNKDYVEKLGFTLPEVLTWDFVWQVSEAAMEKEGDVFKVNGQKVLIPFIYKSTDNMMIQMLHQLGADYSDATGHIGLFSDTTRNILKTVAAHAKTRAFSTFAISSYPANFLNAGQCIFAVDSTAGSTWMGSHAPLLDISADALVEFETVVYPVPQYDPAQISMISQGPSMCLFNKEDPQEVLASWLFMQYLLTDGIQIAYSSTEGYVPVTTKAQRSEDYQDYLSKAGSDDDAHYSVKMDAVNLLLNNTDKTFTTAVFNGSASLRNAAGELIEDVTKSVRRKKTVDDDFITALYEDVQSLYRLDQIQQSGAASHDLGPLPAESIALLATLGICWVGILGYLAVGAVKKKRRSEE